jgi:HTH-type transcriptional regulator/antitoxin HipB
MRYTSARSSKYHARKQEIDGHTFDIFTPTTAQDWGQTLRLLRREAGMTQEEVAEQAGVSQPLLSNVEAGKHGMLVSTLERILEVEGYELYVRKRQ